MSEIKTYDLSPAVKLNYFPAHGFKTMRLAVNMIVPISKENAAKYAILPPLVSRATRQYPDYTALGRKLAELYGASFGSSVQKLGEYQILGISASGIANRYAFGGEDMFAELSGLIMSVLFDTLKDGDGLFPLDGFTQEKRQQLEQKDADFSDKAVYAHQRCYELLFAGKPAGLDRLGSREDIEALRREDLSPAWDRLLREARFEIFALGDCKPDVELLRERFEGYGKAIGLDKVTYSEPTFLRKSEEQPIAQSKLAMAFRASVPEEDRFKFQLMSAVLGEPTSSKLFQNVREKRGLCYYCDSAFTWTSGALFIESGVAKENLGLAEEAILEQLDAVQKGDITEEELQSAKLYMRNSLLSIGDSLHRVEGWYMGRAFSGTSLRPEQAAEAVMSYSISDIVEAAGRLRPAVVFTLKGGEG